MLGYLSPTVIAFILAGNAAFGVLFGLLYCRYGLEAAMLAHAISHLIAFTLAIL
jgi:membrane protease YdiL (CAAX protease family)